MNFRKPLAGVCLPVIAAFALSCEASKLEKALRAAGENRGELEKVLAHYAADPADSLKLRAARFLIENMPGHYSFADNAISAYYTAADHLLNVCYPLEQHRDSLERIAGEFPGLYGHLVEDIETIRADYLIHNIEFAFGDWPAKRFLRHITFEQFCEYLLPYKVTELQPMDYWKDSLRGRYGRDYDSAPWPPRMEYSMAHAANVINSTINLRIQERSIVSNTYPLLAASNIDRLLFGTCDDYSILATAILRSEGIPCFKEDIIWLQKATGHSWYSIINNDGNVMLFKWGLPSSPEQTFFVNEPIAKVRRHVYSRNEKAAQYLEHCRHKAMYPDLFQKDVTPEYIATSDIAVPVCDQRMKRKKWAYIAVFHDREWELVDFGRVKHRKVRFENMGRNVVYLVFGYDGRTLFPVSDPFILQTDGTVEYLCPDKKAPRTISVSRKYPQSDHTFLVGQRMAGAKIEASDRPDFSDAVPIHELRQGEQYRFIPVPAGSAYRYWRYAAPANSYCDISELELYLPGDSVPARGFPVIGTLEAHPALPGSTYDKAFDGDWLTSFSCAQADNAWLGIDFGRPANPEKVRCIPRSDDNGIRTGDEYELYYWSKEGWQSLGKQTGRTHELIYTGVPNSALLLLKNHTRGTEERIFTYEDGKQLWW